PSCRCSWLCRSCPGGRQHSALLGRDAFSRPQCAFCVLRRGASDLRGIGSGLVDRPAFGGAAAGVGGQDLLFALPLALARLLLCDLLSLRALGLVAEECTYCSLVCPGHPVLCFCGAPLSGQTFHN